MKNQLCSEIGQEVQDIVLIDYQIGSFFYLKIMQCQDLTTNSLDLKSKKIKKSNSKIPIPQNLSSDRMWCSGNVSFLSVEVKHFELKQAEKRSWSLGWVTNL